MLITLVDKNLYRGERPKSFQTLQKESFKYVINLESNIYEIFNNDSYEEERAEDFGMVEYNIRCSDLFPPKKAQVQRFLEIVAKGEKTYVHCLHGKDRTGFMCACYRIENCGWTISEAIKEMDFYAFHNYPYFWWKLILWKRYTKIKNLFLL